MQIEFDTGREHFILSRALVLAYDAMSRAGPRHRPASDMGDLKAMIEELCHPQDIALYRRSAVRLLDSLFPDDLDSNPPFLYNQ
jgi:hypothetical protein